RTPDRPADRHRDGTTAGSNCAAWRQCSAFSPESPKAMWLSALTLLQLQRLSFWIYTKIRLTRGICDTRNGRPTRHWELLSVPIHQLACPLVIVSFAALIQRRVLP